MKLVTKIVEYLKGSISEMKKVVWPTKKQTINYSLIVIALSLGMAIFFGVLDYVFNIGLEAIINRGTDAEIINSVGDSGTAAPNFDVETIGSEPVTIGEETPAEPNYQSKPAE